MLKTLLVDTQTGRLETSGDDIARWKNDPRMLIWLDIDGSDPETERELLQAQFGIHPLAVEDAQRDRHPPKIEIFDGHVFLLLKGLDDTTRDIDFGTLQIALFVGERYLVTRRNGRSPSIEQLWDQVRADPKMLMRGPAAVALALALLITDRYLPIVMGLEGRLEDIEDEMFGRPSDRLLTELLFIKKQLKKLRRILLYQQQIFVRLREPSVPFFDKRLDHELIDVYEHLERLGSLTSLHYDIANDLMDGYLSVTSHRLNQVMKTLTIVTVIFVPLGFLAGLYGMNFEHMPELHFRFGYYGLLGFMAMVALSLLFIFRRMRWI